MTVVCNQVDIPSNTSKGKKADNQKGQVLATHKEMTQPVSGSASRSLLPFHTMTSNREQIGLFIYLLNILNA